MKIDLPKEFFRMPRFAPALFAAFLSLLLLLFIRELCYKAKLFLLPSLILYAQSAAFIGMIHRLIGLHYEAPTEKIVEGNKVTFKFTNNEKTIKIGWKILIYLAHLALIVLLIAYNFYRHVL